MSKEDAILKARIAKIDNQAKDTDMVLAKRLKEVAKNKMQVCVTPCSCSRSRAGPGSSV